MRGRIWDLPFENQFVEKKWYLKMWYVFGDATFFE